jgi:drug/metabolite transporter (DMT)-like permease
MNPRAEHRTALAMLLLANLFWGLSFPVIKSLVYEHQQLIPGSGTWFITAMTVAPRFVLGALVLFLIAGRQLRGLTALEVRQGLALGAFAAMGMLFQNDGLQFTSASTSAFLTQLYAIMIPVYVALRARKAPALVVWVACILVLAGVGLLANFNWREMHLGRGEIETLVSSFFFMGQILVLEHKGFGANRVMPVTTVMFVTIAILFSGMALMTAPAPSDVLVPWASGPWVFFMILLTGFCTIGAYILMNKWQPKITATEAGLMYCTEPLFALAMALFLPGIFSRLAGIDYPNESLTWNLFIGGGLITLANVLVQMRPPARPA